jgi:hypothetical protein
MSSIRNNDHVFAKPKPFFRRANNNQLHHDHHHSSSSSSSSSCRSHQDPQTGSEYKHGATESHVSSSSTASLLPPSSASVTSDTGSKKLPDSESDAGIADVVSDTQSVAGPAAAQLLHSHTNLSNVDLFSDSETNINATNGVFAPRTVAPKPVPVSTSQSAAVSAAAVDSESVSRSVTRNTKPKPKPHRHSATATTVTASTAVLPRLIAALQ